MISGNGPVPQSDALPKPSHESPDFRSVIALAGELFGVGDVLLDLGPKSGCWSMANGEMDASPPDSLLAFAIHVSRHDGALIVDNASTDARDFASRLYLHDPVRTAYAGVCIAAEEGQSAQPNHPQGVLVVAGGDGSRWTATESRLGHLTQIVRQLLAGSREVSGLLQSGNRRTMRKDAILHDALGIAACVRWGLQAIECRQPLNRRAVGMQIEAIDELLGLLQSLRQSGYGPEPALRSRSIDLYDWFRKLTDRVAIEASGLGLKVSSHCSVPRGEAQVSLDLLDRLVRNLYVNAMEASPQGGTIYLVFRITADGGFQLEIADEGPGIADDDEHDIFNPGYTRDKKNGTGLGLAICREIASLMDGHLSYRARQPSGCRFLFEFGRPSVLAEAFDGVK